MTSEQALGLVVIVAIFLIVNAGYFWRRRK
jgi:hypothetical protein